jgi:hypothetical protein
MADFRQFAATYPGEASLKNNNPAGISYFGDSEFSKRLTESGVKWSVGTSRPSKEGAKYFSFDTVEDGMKAYDMLWNSGSYSKMKVQDALNRWGTGGISANIDKNKLVKDLTPEERSQLQVAQLAKESPGFLKELKRAGMIVENKKQKGLLEKVVDFIIPGASADSGASSYSFNMPEQQKKEENTRSYNMDKLEDAKAFFQEHGWGPKEESAANQAVAMGLSKEEAFKRVAKRRYLQVSAEKPVVLPADEPVATGTTDMGSEFIKPGVTKGGSGMEYINETSTAARGEMSPGLLSTPYNWIEKIPALGNFAYGTRVGLSQAGEQLGNAVVKGIKGEYGDIAPYLASGTVNAVLSNPASKGVLSKVNLALTAAQDTPYIGDAIKSIFGAIHNGSTALMGDYKGSWAENVMSEEAFNDLKNTVGNAVTAVVPGVATRAGGKYVEGSRNAPVGSGIFGKMKSGIGEAVSDLGANVKDTVKSFGEFENPVTAAKALASDVKGLYDKVTGKKLPQKGAPKEPSTPYAKASIKNGVNKIYKVDRKMATDQNAANIVKGVQALEDMTGVKVGDFFKDGTPMADAALHLREAVTKSQGDHVAKMASVPLDMQKLNAAMNNPMRLVNGKPTSFDTKNMSKFEIDAFNEAGEIVKGSLRQNPSVKDAINAVQMIKSKAYEAFDAGQKQKADAMLAIVNSMEASIGSMVPSYRNNLAQYFSVSRLLDFANAEKGKARYEGILASANPLTLSLFGGAAVSGNMGLVGSSLLGVLGSAYKAKGKDPVNVVNWASDMSQAVRDGRINQADIDALSSHNERANFDKMFDFAYGFAQPKQEGPMLGGKKPEAEGPVDATVLPPDGVLPNGPVAPAKTPELPGTQKLLGYDRDLGSLLKEADKNMDGKLSVDEGKDLLSGLFQKENKPGRTENLTETERLKAEIAAENAKPAKAPAKATKAPAKKPAPAKKEAAKHSTPAKKENVAPKPKETAKNAISTADAKEFGRLLALAKNGKLKNAEERDFKALANKLGQMDIAKKYLK